MLASTHGNTDTTAMSGSRKKLLLNTVFVKLGCGTCRRPNLCRIFHPKPKPKNLNNTYRKHKHSSSSSSSGQWGGEDKCDSTSTTPTPTPTNTSSSNPINLTQAQYQSLMALIQPMQLKSTSDSIGPHSPHQANLLHAIPNGPKRVSKSNGGSHFVFCTTHYTNFFSTTHKHSIP